MSKFARETFQVNNRKIVIGDPLSDDDPVVRNYPHLFTDEQPDVDTSDVDRTPEPTNPPSAESATGTVNEAGNVPAEVGQLPDD